jgi:hypothetical protein
MTTTSSPATDASSRAWRPRTSSPHCTGYHRNVRRLPARPALATRAPGSRADLSGDILSEAFRPGAAAPVAIHIRSELHARLPGQTSTTRRSPVEEGSALRPTDIPLIIDDRIPTAPGYEVHRASPPAVDRCHL